MRSAFSDLHEYLAPQGYDGTSLEKLRDNVYTYRWTWYRSIVVVTAEGLVVTDPFNDEAARGLKAELVRAGLDAPIHTLIYSHYHLDHVEGGRLLAPQNVVAHESCATYWDDLGANHVLAPTRTIRGDTTLVVGGVELHLVDLGKTHTDTLYAVHLPKERLLWTADFGLVRTMLPIGGPDYYYPGARKAFKRLAALEFDTFVPSHFAYGTKDDFLEFVAFTEDLERIGREAAEKFGPEIPRDRDELADAFDFYYDELEAKYADWHGFDQQVVFTIARNAAGTRLGY
jgi:glyoxylase-like metal-dependent hydrolase (beta-lactamase superfamily II)